MKKMFTLIAIMLSVVCIANAQTKQQSKLAKQRAKELTKQGWEATGAAGLEAGLLKVIMAEGDEFQGEGSSDKSFNLAKAKARNNMINEYADYSKTIIKGRVTTEMSDVNEQEAETYIAAYERLVVEELSGVFSAPLLTLKKQQGKLYDARCYYVVKPESVRNAIKEALTKAEEQTEIVQGIGTKISSWIDEGLNVSPQQ